MNMNDTVRIVCENTGRSLFVNRGTSLLQIAEILSLGEREDRPFLAAYVNNRLKELDFAVYSPVSIRYVDITHFEGMRVYQRTLFFVLQKAVYDLFPERKLHIKHSVAKGFYCEIEGMEDLSDEQIVRIKERMRAIVAQDLPIVRQKVTSAEAEAMYEALGLDDKIALLRTRPHLYVTVYSMADLGATFTARWPFRRDTFPASTCIPITRGSAWLCRSEPIRRSSRSWSRRTRCSRCSASTRAGST